MENNRPRNAFQFLSHYHIQSARRAEDGGTVMAWGDHASVVYGCGNCSTPLIIGVPLAMINAGYELGDKFVRGMLVQCTRCDQYNDSELPVAPFVNRDGLFLDTLIDLENRIADEKSEYSILMLSAILRKLLMDGRPLLMQVNRRRRLTIEFNTVVLPANPPDDMIVGIWDVDPAVLPDFPTEPISLERFLARRIGFSGQQPILVRDIVRYMAHVEGGVHAGNPNSAVDAALMLLRRDYSAGRIPLIYDLVRSIGRVTLVAAEPLKRRIVDDIAEQCQPQPNFSRIVKQRFESY